MLNENPHGLLAMVFQRWSPEFRALYGDAFPTAYASVDTETTGFDPASDVVLEFGHVLVRDCKVVSRLNLVIDWTEHDVVDDAWLREALDRVGRRMRLEGKSWRLTYDVLRREGERPEKALPFVRDFLAALKASGTLLVGHNITFDQRLIEGNLVGFGYADEFGFGENGYFDTGAIVKASQCCDDPDMLPRRGDSLASYFARVTHKKKAGVKWSLDGYCLDAYGIRDKHAVDQAQCHTAGYDAYLVHLLMEEFRARVDAEGPGYWSVPAFAEAAEARHREALARNRHRQRNH